MDNWINLIVVIALTLLIYWWLCQNGTCDTSNVKWSAKSSKQLGEYSPKDRMDDVVKEFGNPDTCDANAGGGATWYKYSLQKKGKPYEMIVMLDEAIPHYKPTPHADFLYTWVKMKIDKKSIRDQVLGLSDSVSYDQLKQVLQVRCHFMGANKATIVLAIKIVTGELTLKQIQDNNLYAKYIFRTVNGHKLYDPNAETMYEKEITKYVNSL